MIRKVAALGLAVSVATLTACSSSGGGDKPSSGAPSPSGSGKTPAVASPSFTQATNLPKYTNDVVARKSFTQDTCTATKTGWQMGGSIKAMDATATFDLTVYFTAAQGTVLAAGKGKATAEKGKAGKWSVAANFKPPANVRCVLVGVAKAKA